MAKLDIGGEKLFKFLRENYDVPEYVRAFEIKAEVGRVTSVIWTSSLTEKDETKIITESFKDVTQPT